MGFYLDLEPVGPTGEAKSGFFAETKVPSTFWVLYAIAGFAITCMLMAAHALLRDLARIGSDLDSLLVYSILLAVPFYLAVGMKLLAIRKFVEFSPKGLEVGYRIKQFPIFRRVFEREEIAEIQLLNKKPTSNIAPAYHNDPQYFIRGHWRVTALLKNGKSVVLDRHTEKEALEPLFQSVTNWIK